MKIKPMVKKSSRDDRKRFEARKVEVMDKNEGQETHNEGEGQEKGRQVRHVGTKW